MTKKTVKTRELATHLTDSMSKVKIRLSILGPGQVHGEGDVVLNRHYTTSLRCMENDSEAFLMNKDDFMRLFKSNDEAYKIMFAAAK